MKYLILVPDGAGDEPIENLGGKTPLESARLPHINALAQRGEVGMVRTIPEGVAPGSDAANLSVMGYDPAVYLTGRSPLEAASIGIDMSETDVAFRTNIITVSGDGAYEDLTIEAHSAGDISTEEADQLIRAVNEAFADQKHRFYTGVSYRHCMIVHEGATDYELTPPHDVLGRRVGDYLPKGRDSRFITDMMKTSYDILNRHPVNEERRKKGLNPANSLWIWGQGKKPKLSSFYEKYHILGAAISAVDLIKGIAICAGLDSINVPGATGTLRTNYEGKAKAAVDAFKSGKDFVYVHLEGPDECSHQGDLFGKIACLEDIDAKVLAPVVEYLRAAKEGKIPRVPAGEDFRILIVPDHRTPLRIRTHASEPVPFVLYDSSCETEPGADKRFSERSGETGSSFDSGYALADHFFQRNK